MFRRDDPAMPQTYSRWNKATQREEDFYDSGLTKFEQCAERFTAKWILALPAKPRRWPVVYDINKEAARLGILAAEEFCRQMEERDQ